MIPWYIGAALAVCGFLGGRVWQADVDAERASREEERDV